MFDNFVWKSWIGLPIAVVIALVVALVILGILSVVMRVASKRREWPTALASGARHPFRLLVAIIAVWIAVTFTFPDPEWAGSVNQFF